ncbi:MAG: DUF4388 domain-containing protein [Desulfomonilia bacterium]|nr:DUF4388 domain-containing protein [Desulfomonilia bacterium]
MALLGTLKGFGVTEIFQLISQQMKTGSLILSSPKAKVTIAFENGVIVGITSDKWDMDPRAEVLLKAGFLRDKEVKAAFEQQKKNAQKWHEILISQGNLKESFIAKATNVVIKQILLDIFQWREGSYRFEDWDLETENMLICHIQTEGVILDTLRMIDEWPMIKQKIPPVDYCPVTIMSLTEEIVAKHHLSDVDMHIFDLIDEKNTIESIVMKSLEPPFEALGSLVRLIDLGLIEVFPEGTKEKRDFSSARNAFFRFLAQASIFILFGLALTGLVMVGEPRITRELIPQEITSILDHQKALLKEIKSLERLPSTRDRDSYVH